MKIIHTCDVIVATSISTNYGDAHKNTLKVPRRKDLLVVLSHHQNANTAAQPFKIRHCVKAERDVDPYVSGPISQCIADVFEWAVQKFHEFPAMDADSLARRHIHEDDSFFGNTVVHAHPRNHS